MGGWRQRSPTILRREITGEPVVYREGKRVMAMLYCEGKIVG
jgi:hypothetical protein